ncbi:hypothetical protein ABZ783_32230 [Micromonospora sp. NPDC047738]|uniref:hypothetical protein n=1 Tax=Micromonospora sp. NPDC047738 TaxID=3155741 RepID=UPI0033C02850
MWDLSSVGADVGVVVGIDQRAAFQLVDDQLEFVCQVAVVLEGWHEQPDGVRQAERLAVEIDVLTVVTCAPAWCGERMVTALLRGRASMSSPPGGPPHLRGCRSLPTGQEVSQVDP